jgi:hypothetical protein
MRIINTVVVTREEYLQIDMKQKLLWLIDKLNNLKEIKILFSQSQGPKQKIKEITMFIILVQYLTFDIPFISLFFSATNFTWNP